MTPESLIRAVTLEAQTLLDGLYAAGEPVIGSALDQAGLRNGRRIVEDYLSHGETAVALEHLLYMVAEPPLILSAGSRADIRRAAELLGMTHLLGKCP